LRKKEMREKGKLLFSITFNLNNGGYGFRERKWVVREVKFE